MPALRRYAGLASDRRGEPCSATAVILAAGSRHPHEIDPAQDAAQDRRAADAAPSAGELRAGVRPHRRGGRAGHGGGAGARPRRTPSVVQQERLGTAHAALQAADAVRRRRRRGAVCRQPADPARHAAPACWRAAPRRRRAGAAGVPPGRSGPLRPRDRRATAIVERIVEWADATEVGRGVGAVQCRRAVRRRAPTCALAARGARRQRQGRILPDRRGRPGARRRRAGRGGGSAV